MLHKSRNNRLQWHVGLSYSKFGDRNVPQTSFEYIGRLYQIEDGRLPNTSGNSNHFVAGFIDDKEEVVAASDAFFPFVDGIERLVQSGVTAVIQPSGSIRDNEIIKYANETNTILVFSKTRHFRH